MDMPTPIKKKTFLPQELKQTLWVMTTMTFGVMLMILSLLMVMSLMSYGVNDTSFSNSQTEPKFTNALGFLGSYSSDLMLQSFGLGAILIPILLFCWGWHFIKRRKLKRLWIKLTFLPLILSIIGLGLSGIPTHSSWSLHVGYGGFLGDLFRKTLEKFIITFVSFPNSLTITILSLIVGLAFYLSILNFKLKDWKFLGYITLSCGKYLIKALKKFIKLIYNLIFSRKKNTHAQQIDFNLENEQPQPISITPTSSKTKWSKRHLKEQQNDLDLSDKKESINQYTLPPLSLMTTPKNKTNRQISEQALSQNARLLENVLEDFGIQGKIVNVCPGPIVTSYELEPAPGLKSSRVISLSDDIARSMSALSVRVALIPGRNVIGIELPNQTRDDIYLKTMIASKEFEESSSILPLCLGKDIGGKPIIADLTKMPHLMIAGTTGSGKSVGVNAMILSLLYALGPDQCRFIMIDPKMLELSIYDKIPHLLTPVVTDPKKAIVALKWTVKEMENRYTAMSQLGVRNISGYNKKINDALDKGTVLTRKIQTGFDGQSGKPIIEKENVPMVPFPYIVVIVDEMADLMMVAGKEVEASIQRLAQMARAAGIHLIMATQRPSVDVITGTIKANFPTRISYSVTSKIDSRTILGEQGAEQLLGRGDMLYMAQGGRIQRLHGPFVSDHELKKITDYICHQTVPEYPSSISHDLAKDTHQLDSEEGSQDDKLYDQAVEIVLSHQKASTSFLQRKLSIGYNRAARLIEKMEKQGLISEGTPGGKRQILVESS